MRMALRSAWTATAREGRRSSLLRRLPAGGRALRVPLAHKLGERLRDQDVVPRVANRDGNLLPGARRVAQDVFDSAGQRRTLRMLIVSRVLHRFAIYVAWRGFPSGRFAMHPLIRSRPMQRNVSTLVGAAPPPVSCGASNAKGTSLIWQARLSFARIGPAGNHLLRATPGARRDGALQGAPGHGADCQRSGSRW